MPPILRKPNAGNVTLKQIARELGVSHQLVSFALNGTGTVGEEMRERIKSTAERMGYRRNGSAMAMQSGRFGSAALLLSTHEQRSFLPQKVWEGVHNELASHEMHLMMVRLPDDELAQEGVTPKVLREWMTDGLIVDYTHAIPSRLVESITKHHLPAVWLNVKQEFDAVYPDDFEAGRRAGQLFADAGRLRVVYTSYAGGGARESEHYSTFARRDGAASVLERVGGDVDEIIAPHHATFHEQVAIWKAYLSERKPQGVLGYAPTFLEPVLRAAELLGLSVPDDLALVTFGASHAWTWGHHLTCYTLPEAEVGRQAVRMLLHKLERPADVLSARAVNFGFDAGTTCPTKT